MKKVLFVALILLLVLGGAIWYFVSFRMDSMLEQRIESTASRTFGTRVSVGSVKTDIRSGSLTISDITVANPPGFSNPNAFSLDNVEASVDYGNLDIKRVVIDRPEIVVEEMGGETNFSKMLAELEKLDSEPESSGNGKPEPVIVIHHFRLNESRAAFESASLDRYSDLKVDAVELNDIRGTPTEVAKIIATEVVSEIASDAAIELLKAQAQKKLDDVEGKVSDKLKQMLGGDKDSGGG
jgi:hypothetical protein